jgi:putative endonuclease
VNARTTKAFPPLLLCYISGMKLYYVYILGCRDGSYYTGVTNDYHKRFEEHQSGEDPDSYTFKRRPLRLVYVVEYKDVDEAIAWETRVKGWSRRKKEALITREFGRLPQLSRSAYRKRIECIRKTMNEKVTRSILLDAKCHPELVEGSTQFSRSRVHASTGSA